MLYNINAGLIATINEVGTNIAYHNDFSYWGTPDMAKS